MNSKLIILIFLVFSTLFSIPVDELSEEEISDLTGYYEAEPLDLNSADQEEIYQLPFIDEITSFRIYERISSKGDFVSISQLVSEMLLTQEEADILRNCIILTSLDKGGYSAIISSRFKRTLEESRGYRDSIYLGNRDLYSHKYKFKSQKVSFNALMDKEPGETEYTDNFKANIIYREDDNFRVILGNFSFSSFTGLLQKEAYFTDPFNTSVSSKIKSPVRSNISFADYFGYNGAAVDHKLFKGLFSISYGVKDISASLEDEKISSVNLFAYTRTGSEIEKHYNSEHRLFSTSYQSDFLGVSYQFSYSHESFDRELSENSSLFSGSLAEISLRYGNKKNNLRMDAATDTEHINFKTFFKFVTEDMKIDLFYGFANKDKLSLISPGMLNGKGEHENFFGLKVKNRIGRSLYLISENLIFIDEIENGNYPGADFRLSSEFKTDNIITGLYFKYKFDEEVDEDFVSDGSSEYNTKFKLQYQTDVYSITSVLRYSDDNNGGYGYMFTQVFDYFFSYFRLRAGADIYFTDGITVYSALSDIGKYPTLASYSGKGNKIFFRVQYAKGPFKLSAGISENQLNDNDESGSGYDIIDSDSTHKVEFNFEISL